MREVVKTYQLGGTDIKFTTGKIATLAQGSVLIQAGGTTVLAVTSIAKEDAQQDFFPLSVEYIEKLYARGAISNSKYKKREGLPTDEAIIKARQVDHSIRSLFPKSFKKPTLVTLTVLTYDMVNDPEALAVLGASLSIMLTGMPYYGPSSSVIACVDENKNVVLNPKAEDREKYMAEFLLSGVDDKMLNIEGWGKQVTEDVMDAILDESMKYIKEANAIQTDFVNEVKKVDPDRFGEKESESYSDLPVDKELIDYVKENSYKEIENSLFQPERADRYVLIKGVTEKLSKEVAEKFQNEDKTPKYSAMDLDKAIEYIARKIIRTSLLKEDKRRLGRGLREIRSMSAEVDLLPTVHGSALFNRGLTQSLSIVTLGPKSLELLVEDMEGETAKGFMHHYNMPPYTTGEAGKYNYHPGRREIGHGAIGENALKHVIPSQDEFPYTIRVVSEIMTSNGSTSMAATCASSMALMAAGVPLKAAVGGISVGLVTEDGNEDNYKLLMDIEGIEDFYGDMDFKVTGTRNGITAIQYENKLKGVKLPVLKEAFRLAKEGRNQVLDVMDSAIKESRTELSPNAPVVESVQIKQDQIGMLIGPGGKNIKELIAQSSEYSKGMADINIDDDGMVMITASNKKQMDFIKSKIEEMFGEAKVGEEYTGVVDKVMPYGIFVNVTSSITGLCHMSEISDRKDNYDLTKVFSEGDVVKVKVIKVEDGRTSFSLKGVEQSQEVTLKMSKIAELPKMQFQQSNGGGFNGNRRFADRRR